MILVRCRAANTDVGLLGPLIDGNVARNFAGAMGGFPDYLNVIKWLVRN